MSPYAEGVGEGDLHLGGTGFVGDIVQVAVRVGVFVVDGGRDDPLLYGLEGYDRLDRSCRS